QPTPPDEECMRRGRGLVALTLVLTSAVVAMCVFPTEHDADVFVTLDSLTHDTISRAPTSVGPLVLIQGSEGDVHATAWHRQSGGPSVPVPNVSFRWSVSDTTLARIDATTGHLVAIKSGITQVRVVATNFDAGASPATLAIRLSARVTIDTVSVIRRDLYEPNDIAPTLIDLETSKPFPGTVLDALLFLNPALAFEPLPRDVSQGADWYRLRQTKTRDVTIVLSSVVPGTFQTFLTDQLGFQASDTSYHIGADSWTFGPQ